MRSWRHGRARRVACAMAALLLGGCETLARRHIAERPLTPSGGRSVVVLRVTDPPGGPARAAMLADARFAHFGLHARRFSPVEAGTDLSVAPSYPAGTAGWVNLAMAPGRYVLHLRPAGAEGPQGEARFSFVVPDAPGLLYIGTFRRDCASAGRRGCRIAPDAVDETEAATAMLARENPAAGTPRRALAQPYPPPLAALGLPRPNTVTLGVDIEALREAVNWDALTEAERRSLRQREEAPRSEVWPEGPVALRPTAGADLSGAGAAAGVVASAAAVVIAIPIALIVAGIATGIREQRAEDAARDAIERQTAFARAQERWNACLAGIAGTLAPEAVTRDLQASPLHAARGTPWRAQVSRLVLRPCGRAGENRYGLEVMTRWTARRGGEDPPAFDAAFSRGVADGTPDRRLRHAQRAPWDVPTATEAACRPLEEWCGEDGAARLRADVLRAVTEARDAIMAGR